MELAAIDGAAGTAYRARSATVAWQRSLDLRRRVERERRVVLLINQLRAPLLQRLARMLGTREDAEDVLQEACMKLLRVEDLWAGEHHARAFFIKIATLISNSGGSIATVKPESKREMRRSSMPEISFGYVSLVMMT